MIPPVVTNGCFKGGVRGKDSMMNKGGESYILNILLKDSQCLLAYLKYCEVLEFKTK